MYRPSFIFFLALLAIILVVFFCVICPQLDIIANPIFFWVMFLALLALSFFSSAIESALSVASKTDEIIAEAKADLAKAAQDRSTLMVKMSTADDDSWARSFDKDLRQARRRFAKLKFKEYTLSESGRGVSVGAFASLSVVLNVALTAFLPLSLSGYEEMGRVGLYYPTVSIASISGLNIQLRFLDLSGSQLFLFSAITLPLLLAGKIIPKELGSHYFKFFAVKLNWLVRLVVILFGWLPAGALWPFRRDK